MTAAPLKKIYGQPSYTLHTRRMELAVTQMGGHIAPVRFFRDEKTPFAPYRVAPWWNETLERDCPAILRVLRGDFFCMPFGGSDRAWRGEHHPPHGETAGEKWSFEALAKARKGIAGAALSLSMRVRVRPGRVRKVIALLDDHNAIYCRHVISGMSGRMCFAHHPTLAFPDAPGSGLVAVSPFIYGQVKPDQFEFPEKGGYSILRPGAPFEDLSRVERIDGAWADLTRYPARRGFEDIVMVCSDPALFPAWSAVTFPTLGAVWFTLKDPAVLPSTMLWHDNGGRHYAPWSGRSVNTLGMEDVLSYYGQGLAESAEKNPLSKKGIPTSVSLSARRPLAVNYIQAAARIPSGFGHVREIAPVNDSAVRLRDEHKRDVVAQVNWTFLRTGRLGAPELDEIN